MSATRCSAIVLLFAPAVGVFSGCAVGPNFHKPQAPARAAFAPAPLPEASSSAPVHGGEAQHFVAGRDISFEWWELFQSPALDSLIRQAFKANPTIAAAQAALAQAQELVRAQRGFFFPTVAAGFQAERVKVAGNNTQSSSLGIQANGNNLGQPVQAAVPLYS